MLPTVLKFLWSNSRLILIGYCLISITLVVVFFFIGQGLSRDFNALTLIQYLNITFLVCGPFLGQQVLYRFYQNETHYFFAPLPISPIIMRIYEQLSFFIIGVFPYLIVLPVLLFVLYYNGLWSTPQVLNFLGFQMFFWFVFANFSLLLAMTGRLCWYLFTSIIICSNLYLRYNKNYQFDFQGFYQVDQVLYKSELLTVGLILNYGVLCILLYGAALALSLLISKRSFSLLHAKETGLSRGLFTVFLVFAITGNFYFTQKLETTKSKFSGLYLSAITGQTKSYWSSSVQLDEVKLMAYTSKMQRLQSDVSAFAEAYQLDLPAIHYQHNPNQHRVKPLTNEMHADGDLEIEFNFANLDDRFADTERDIIIENLIFLSRGWLGREGRLIFLRGLAANWSWRHLDSTLLRQRLNVLLSYPDFYDQFEKAQLLSIYQNSGACLFDALAANRVAEIAETISKKEMIAFIQSQLNLDHSWLTVHLFRSIFNSSDHIDILAMNLPKFSENTNEIVSTEHGIRLVDYDLELKEIFPKVFQPIYHIYPFNNESLQVQVHLYEHQSPGRLVDTQQMLTNILTTESNGEYTTDIRMLQSERFSTTLSWYSKALDCRINSPWRHVAL